MTTDAVDTVDASASSPHAFTSQQWEDPATGKKTWERNVYAMQSARRRTLDLDLYAKHIGALNDVLDRLGYDIRLVKTRDDAEHPDEAVAELEAKRLQRRQRLEASRRRRLRREAQHRHDQ
jgi:hypothetical protein